MVGAADAFRAALLDAEFAPLAGLLLHRVTMEDGLFLHVGRDAVIAALAAEVSLLSARALDLHHHRGMIAATLTGKTTTTWRGGLMDRQAALHRHYWLDREGDRIAAVTALTDWRVFAASSGADWEAWARDLGVARPMHRPLGEIRSGRGQYWPDRTGDPVADAVNRRALVELPAPNPATRDLAVADWLDLLRRVPDATLTPDRASGPAALHRLHGHVAGRRASLPVSTLGGQPLIDHVALEALAHRPFL